MQAPGQQTQEGAAGLTADLPEQFHSPEPACSAVSHGIVRSAQQAARGAEKGIRPRPVEQENDAVFYQAQEEPPLALHRITALLPSDFVTKDGIAHEEKAAAQRGIVLDRPETEHAHVAARMTREAVTPKCLGAVFKQHQAVHSGEANQGVHWDAGAEQMSRQQRDGSRRQPAAEAFRIGLERPWIQIDRNGHESVATDDFGYVGNGDGGHQDLRAAGKPGCLETGIEAAAKRKKKEGFVGVARGFPAGGMAFRSPVAREALAHAEKEVAPADIESLARNHLRFTRLPARAGRMKRYGGTDFAWGERIVGSDPTFRAPSIVFPQRQ